MKFNNCCLFPLLSFVRRYPFACCHLQFLLIFPYPKNLEKIIFIKNQVKSNSILTESDTINNECCPPLATLSTFLSLTCCPVNNTGSVSSSSDPVPNC